MKLHSLFVEILIFLVVTLFFLCPPLFTTMENTSEQVFFQWNFPLTGLILASFALLLFILYHNSYKSKVNNIHSFPFSIIPTVCMLFTSSFFMNFLSYAIPCCYNQTVKIELPTSVINWIYCILNFIFSAFYEEVLYRFYFTDKLINILKRINDKLDKKVTVIICEIIGCAIFAFGHSYLGIFAVINAAIAHFILRYTYKKSNSIIPGFIAHFIYNVTSLILL